MKSIVAADSRHLVLRLEEGESLPDALLQTLRDQEVATGWLRASGIVTEAEIKAFRSDHGAYGPTRRIAGPVQIVSLEGSIGVSRGDLSVGLRVVLARETESGLETIAGELVGARVVAVEAFVTALDDVAVARTLDERTATWLFDPAPGTSSPLSTKPTRPEGERVREREAPPEPPAAWAQAVAASSNERPREAEAPRAQIPQRPQKPKHDDEEMVFPEAGDIVEHFAFGRCEVLKSDGDRLHLKVGKDGRIREIALEMLRVTPLESGEENRRRFKLDRKL
ncbi:MAG TPA: PPC domain-containing DNA-binding protein [Polyangiaceae bacterium]